MSTRWLYILSSIWCLLVWGSYGTTWRQINWSETEIGKTAARSHFEKDVLFRAWATQHGGVYVPPSTRTPPNPYLKDLPERDVETKSGKTLTLVNPAYMTRQVYELAGENLGVRGHITSLNPLRPENRPDEWEKRALQSFERGATEYSSKVEIDNQAFVRLMRPLMTESGCLVCHQKQGYQVGQIRGGISITVPLAPYVGILEQEKTQLLIWHLVIGVLGLLGIGIGATRLRRAGERLHDSEAVFHTMADWTSDWEYWETSGRQYRYISPSVENVTGYGPQELMADSDLVNTVVLEQDQALWNSHVEQFHRGENPSLASIDFRIVRKDGAVRWVTHRCRPVIGPNGEYLGRRVSVQDITEKHGAEDALAEREKHYRVIYHASQDFITINRLSDGVYLDVNQPYLDALGYTRDELIGHTPQELGVWAIPAERERFVETLNSERRCQNYEACFKGKNGQLVWGLASSTIVDLGGTDCIYSVTRNISERRQAELALRESEKNFRALYEASQDFIFINRLDSGVFLEVNPPFLRALGCQSEEVIGKTSPDIGFWDEPADRQKFYEILTKDRKIQGVEVRVRSRSGQLAWWLISASIVELNGVDCIYSVARDITERKLAEKRVNELAFFDQLTGLPNRALLLDRLGQAMAGSSRSGQYCALLMIDLDNFKSLNDTQGHDVGDQLLKQVGRRLAGLVRAEDTVARVGGDEFLVILSGLSPAREDAALQAELVSEKIVATLGGDYLLVESAFHSTPSVGVTLFIGQDTDRDSLLKQVDIAMYRAKDKGGNGSCFFDSDMETMILKRASLIEDLRNALQKQQFILHYQAQVSGGRLSGVEVLARWQHPEKGLVSPADFIPLAEETGLITSLGRWVLQTACSQLAKWATDARLEGIPISVNVSAKQFRQADFVEQVTAALVETGANPQRLKIELTESALATNIDDLIEKMFLLKSKGIRFSLDDFGTGYSSLAYLKRLPLDQLKIDRSFVRDLFTDSNDVAIVRTIIALADTLGLGIIAEGVETAEQRDFLAGIGCHVYQGYFFSRPLPLEDFERLPMIFGRA